jgi:5-methylcytosine-specific restriction protein A
MARVRFLAEHPWCVRCDAEGGRSLATVVDHRRPHKGDPELFWDERNWDPLCKRHHDQKTVTEDGGFGRARSAA